MLLLQMTQAHQQELRPTPSSLKVETSTENKENQTNLGFQTKKKKKKLIACTPS